MTRYFILLLFLLTQIAFSQSGYVYHLRIENEIDLGLIPYIKRGIEAAEQNSAKAIIFEINTFGGRLDAATEIKDLILNCKVPTIAFVNKRAISAGALITLSAKRIVMSPSSSIGAATVVNESGEKQAEKYQSYMRSEMRATAEANGRNPKIAEAMVDETVKVEGLDDTNKLVTLTAKEAIKWGIADTILPSIRKIIESQELHPKEIIRITPSTGEHVVRFLNNPIVISILLMVGMLGLFVEIKTPGWGFAGTISLIAFFLFFGTGIVLEIVSVFDVILFVSGVVLLIAEIFIIPGFGLFGLLGIILVVISMFLGLLPDFHFITPDLFSNAVIEIASAMVASIVVGIFLVKYLPQTTLLNNFILKTNIDGSSGYISNKEITLLIDKIGIAISDLRPAGFAEFDGKRIDVVTEGNYIEKGQQVIVIKEEGSKVLVKLIERS